MTCSRGGARAAASLTASSSLIISSSRSSSSSLRSIFSVLSPLRGHRPTRSDRGCSKQGRNGNPRRGKSAMCSREPRLLLQSFENPRFRCRPCHKTSTLLRLHCRDFDRTANQPPALPHPPVSGGEQLHVLHRLVRQRGQRLPDRGGSKMHGKSVVEIWSKFWLTCLSGCSEQAWVCRRGKNMPWQAAPCSRSNRPGLL